MARARLTRPACADAARRAVAALLLLALLGQFFIAGMAALTAPDWWAYHKLWVSAFQWLTLLFPPLVWFSEKKWTTRLALSAAPLVQVALQYFLAHRALDGTLLIGIGLHATNAALMVVTTTLLIHQGNIAALHDSDTVDDGRQ